MLFTLQSIRPIHRNKATKASDLKTIACSAVFSSYKDCFGPESRSVEVIYASVVKLQWEKHPV